MVHLRINEREPNPNPYVNFITVLPMHDSTLQEATRHLLRALAAQVKPIMKDHGFTVNSLEEYEYNRVFAGRNWNHGETIELVLRSSTGSLLSTHWLMSTLCHELAHIKHANHGPAFQALWRQLEREVCALQSRGYYGDGYWSSGARLVDSAQVAGRGIETSEFPEYMCGGAHPRARPVSRRSRKVQGSQVPKKRKAGSRVHSSVFDSVGRALNENLDEGSRLHGVGFRKKAASKRAREERALAAERRIQTLHGEASSSKYSMPPAVADDIGSEDESETDHDRRRILLEAIEEKDLDALRATALASAHDFILPGSSSSKEGRDGDAGARYSTAPHADIFGPSSDGLSSKTSQSDTRPKKKRKTSQSNPLRVTPITSEATAIIGEVDSWDCMVCTLSNKPNHLACSACSTPRGETEWVGGA